MMILSTNGSKIRPSFVTWLYFLAHQPSIQSVEAAMTNTIIAATKCPSGISTNTTIDSTNRAIVNTLGTLRIALEGCGFTAISDDNAVLWALGHCNQRNAIGPPLRLSSGDTDQIIFLRRHDLHRHKIARLQLLLIARDKDQSINIGRIGPAPPHPNIPFPFHRLIQNHIESVAN